MKLTTFASILLLLIGCVAHKKTVVVVRPPPKVVVVPPPVVVVKPPPNVVVVGGALISRGPLIARPPYCRRSEQYWATDVDTLYVCIDGSWEERYIPITYPIQPTAIATPTVRVMGVTQTQAVIDINVVNTDGSPYAGTCTVTVLDSSGNPANDVNSALFTGSNLDSRPGGTTIGNDRYFVAGTRVSNKALDGLWYSRALQANAPYTAQANCGGAASAIVGFVTANPPPDNGFTDAPNWDSAAFGNRAEPSIDWSNQDKSYIDPQTGVLIKRLGPSLSQNSNSTRALFGYAKDLSGTAAWTNPQYAISTQVSGNLASTSTLNAKLLLGFKGLQAQAAWNNQPMDVDILLRLYGNGPSGATVGVCLTIDSATCNTVPQTVTMPTTNTEVDFPSGYPAPMFKGWGQATKPMGPPTFSNGPSIGNVAITGGSTLTQTTSTGFYNMLPDWPVGSNVLLTGPTGTGIAGLCPTTGTGGSAVGGLCNIASFNRDISVSITQSLATDTSGSTLTAAAGVGATSLTVAGAGILYPGNHIILDNGLGTQEKVQVAPTYVIGSTTVPLVAGTLNAHALGAFVYWGGLDDSTAKLNGAFSPGATSISAQVTGALITAGAASGATSITLTAAPAGVIPNQTIVIDTGGLQESKVVAAGYTSGATIPLTTGLTNTHAGGASVAWGNALLGPGESFTINAGAGNAETVTATSGYVIGTTTIPLTTGLVNSHATNEQIAWSNAITFTPANAGVLVWLQSGTSVSLSATFDQFNAYQGGSPVNAAGLNCSLLPITDIATDRHGTPLTGPPQTGYLCLGGGNRMVLFIPATGESRLMSTFWDPNVAGGGYMIVGESAWSSTDPKTVYGTNVSTNHLYSAQLQNPVPGVYVEYVPGPTLPPPADNMVWTDLSNTAPPLNTQVANWDGPAGAAFATGLFGTGGQFALGGVYSSTIYTAQAPGGDAYCINAILNGSGLLVGLYDSFDTLAGLRWGACHQSALMLGTDLIPLTVNFNSGFASMQGPHVAQIVAMKHGPNWVTYSAPITAAVVATGGGTTFTSVGLSLDPSFNTLNGTTVNSLPVGPIVTLAGFTGFWAPANGTWVATVASGDSDHFTVPGIISGSWGAMTGTPTISAAPPILHNKVTAVSNTGPAVVTTSQGGWGQQGDNLPGSGQGHRLLDGDQIAFGALANSITGAPMYAQASGHSNVQFGVFQDAALTTPVDSSVLLGTVGGAVYFVETCPAGLPTGMTSGMPFENGGPAGSPVGAVGNRCITVKIKGLPCTWWALPAMSTPYPCQAYPGDTTKAQPVAVVVPGDSIVDKGRGQFGEVMTVVKVVVNSSTDEDLTLMRMYGYATLSNPGPAIGSNIADTHQAGWTATMAPAWPGNGHGSGYYSISGQQYLSQNPQYSNAHGDNGCGNAPGLLTYAAGGPDSIANVQPLTLLNAPVVYTKNEKFVWNGLTGMNSVESYPGHRQCNAPKSEMVWKTDWNAYLPASANIPGTPSGVISGTKPALVTGFSNTYTLPVFGSSVPVNVKKAQMYSWGGYRMYKDISGPGSVINDSTVDSFCVARVAGECVASPASTPGQGYVSALGLSINPSGYCVVNTLQTATPCLIAQFASGGSAVQVEIDPVDTTARRWRRLSSGLTAPGIHWSYANWRNSPDGGWGFFFAPYINGWRSDNFVMRIPYWVGASTEIRDQYVKVPVSFSGFPGGIAARARFGYAENGTATQFYCTTRQEACSTDTAPTAGDPFSYVTTDPAIGSGVIHQSCGSGCTIQIPTVPGRVLYYVIDALDGTGNTANVLWTGPLQIKAVN